MRLDPVSSAAAACGGAAPAISSIISKNLTPETPSLPPRLLSAIKSTVRSSPAETHAAVPALLAALRHPHSHPRYLAVLVADELFMRSKLFRTLLVSRLDDFLSLAVGFRSKQPLPPPATAATALRTKTIETLEKWNHTYGIHYPQVRIGYNYLKNVLHYRFPNRVEAASRRERERREREERTRVILTEKFRKLKANYQLVKDEIRCTVDEVEECLEILSAKEEEDEEDGVEEFTEFTSLELRRIRQESLKEGGMVYENAENKAVFDAMREAYKILVTKRLSSVREWISVLVRVDVDVGDSGFRDAALKEFIDLRNLVQLVEKRCRQLGCTLDEKAEEDEEDFWEEGTIDVSVVGVSSPPKVSVEGTMVDPTRSKGKRVVSEKATVSSGVKKQFGSVDSNSTPGRSELLAEAPVMNWGPFLDNWGSKQDVFANQRGMELDNHWGRVDYDATIPAEKIAELNVHRMVYKEEAVETQPCLAPLKKGGLCQRKDLKVCPFHGPIVPRDAEGNPLENNPSEGETEKESSIPLKEFSSEETDQMEDFIVGASDSAEGVAERLAKRAVKNVRERDVEMKSLKRARLAKVREHNETVLREAALASTSYSEHVTASHEQQIGIRAKKTKSASRQQKKVTPKDRIAQRLLKTKVTESSIRQITQGEHSKYREAFPNQW